MTTDPSQRVRVPGSERAPLPGARKVGIADPNERVQVSIYVSSRGATSKEAMLQKLIDQPAQNRRHLSREEFAASFGADPGDLEAVASFARSQGLAVEKTDAARRVVQVSGTVDAMSRAFGVELARYEYPGGSYRGREGSITIPAELDGLISGLHGLDNRPAARPHVTVAAEGVRPRQDGGPYSPVEVATAYDFPRSSWEGATGTATCKRSSGTSVPASPPASRSA